VRTLETRAVWAALTVAHRHLAELKGLCDALPNEGILLETLGIEEAEDSSEIENIHPFYDGNGRTGRILNLLMLQREGLLDLPVLISGPPKDGQPLPRPCRARQGHRSRPRRRVANNDPG